MERFASATPLPSAEAGRCAAHLARIAIFPIKSLDGAIVQEATFAPGGGLVHDREFALFDADGRVINGKRDPRVHELRTEFAPDFASVTISARGDRRTFSLVDRRELETWLSEFFATTVRLQYDPERGFPDDTKAPGPTVVSTATLREVASWFEGMTLESARRRFRANLELDGVPAFWEDRLYAEAGDEVPFAIGAAFLTGTNPCQRCAVPSRDPDTAAVIEAFSKAFSERREATLPHWAARSRFNHFYRLAVNTAVPPETIGRTLRLGDLAHEFVRRD